MKKLSQKERILRAFKENNNVLSLKQILDMNISQYGTRINELKKKYKIENQYLGTFNGVRHTQFILKGLKEKYEPSEGDTHRIYEMARQNRLKNEGEKKQLTLI